MREVDAYKLFSHVPTIISAIDHSVATERGGVTGGDDVNKTVYVLLPYYRRGNLQDMINANLVNHSKFPERKLMVLFLGVCKALRAMHEYRTPVESMQMGNEEDGHHRTRGKRTEEEEEGEQERPLMESENRAASSGGGGHGRKGQSYVHRDIKPGKKLYLLFVWDEATKPVKRQTKRGNRNKNLVLTLPQEIS